MALTDLTKKVQNADWQKLQTMLSPAGMSKLDAFLDKLIKRGGMALYVAGGAWAVAAVMILLTFSYTTQIKTLKEDLEKTVANTPLVPTINMVQVDETELKKYIERLSKTYTSIDARDTGPGYTVLQAKNIRNFNQWRGFMKDVQYGGPNWRVSIQNLCAGRNCEGGQPLVARLKIERLEIVQPTIPQS